MATLNKLLAQRAAIERQIDELQQLERAGVITQLREQMEAYGITALELTGRKRRTRSDKGVPRKKRRATTSPRNKARGRRTRQPAAA